MITIVIEEKNLHSGSNVYFACYKKKYVIKCKFKTEKKYKTGSWRNDYNIGKPQLA